VSVSPWTRASVKKTYKAEGGRALSRRHLMVTLLYALEGRLTNMMTWFIFRLDTLMRSLTVPLKEVIKAYEYELSVLHPFEATLADLTVRARAKQGCKSLEEVQTG
jgi:hypothetical protein